MADQKAIESKLMNYEFRDHLTGLFNRRSLDLILEKEIEKAKRSKSEKLRALLFISLESYMFKAFGGNQFIQYSQPIVDMTGKILGCEALIRWRHPERGLVSPGEFIPLAEETGIILSIGKWTLCGACKQIKKWAEAYDIYVSINISAREFESNKLTDVVEGGLKSVGGLDPGHLKLEVTESASMANPEFTIDQMNKLFARGIELQIDDFGTGFSSLSYLKGFPAKTIQQACACRRVRKNARAWNSDPGRGDPPGGAPLNPPCKEYQR